MEMLSIPEQVWSEKVKKYIDKLMILHNNNYYLVINIVQPGKFYEQGRDVFAL